MKNNKPVIRFKGFSEEWEEKELGNEVDFFSGLTYSPTNIVKVGGTLVLRSSNVKNGEIVYDDNVYVNSNVVNSENVKVGDIVVVVRNGSRSLIGKHAQIKQSLENTVIGAFMTGIHCQQPTFINALLDTVQYNKEIEKNLGATINQITTGAFKKMIFKFPQSIEQTQIGNFFKNLDNLSTLHQRKYEKLGTLKKAMLEKMFPKNGANVPEIRFKGFEGAWEESKLGEVTDVLDGDRGNNYPNGNDLQSTGHTLFLSASNVTSKGFKFDNNQYITEEKSNSMGNGKIMLDDIILTSRGSIGNIALYNSSVEQQTPFARINSGMLILRSKNFITPSFISQFLKSPLGKKQIDLISFGSAQPQLTKKDVSNYSLVFPSKEEQEKIGTYFKNLDDLLKLHEKEIEKLKNLKKALLEKMFV